MMHVGLIKRVLPTCQYNQLQIEIANLNIITFKMSQFGTSLLLLLAAAATTVFSLPNPMAQSDGSPTRETDKCDRFAYEEWIGDQVACEEEAGDELKTILSSFDFTDDQLRQGLCSQIRGRVRAIQSS